MPSFPVPQGRRSKRVVSKRRASLVVNLDPASSAAAWSGLAKRAPRRREKSAWKPSRQSAIAYADQNPSGAALLKLVE